MGAGRTWSRRRLGSTSRSLASKCAEAGPAPAAEPAMSSRSSLMWVEKFDMAGRRWSPLPPPGRERDGFVGVGVGGGGGAPAVSLPNFETEFENGSRHRILFFLGVVLFVSSALG